MLWFKDLKLYISLNDSKCFVLLNETVNLENITHPRYLVYEY